jgi:hypothetical protein
MDSIVGALVVIVIALVLFLVLRAVMLWYWKVDIIVGRLEYMADALDKLTEDRRKQYRIDYYTAVALKDNQQAYKCLMNIVMDDLLKTRMKNEERKKLYEDLKSQHSSTFEKLGYSFPEYELLF